jgi:hypothetical protein
MESGHKSSRVVWPKPQSPAALRIIDACCVIAVHGPIIADRPIFEATSENTQLV